MLYTPRLEFLGRLPYDNYDEWYVFTSPTRLNSCDVFVNFGGFTLRDPVELLAGLDPTWDRTSAKYFADGQEHKQARFWSQLESFDAESYISDGYNFIFATANADLFTGVATALQSA